MPFYKVIKSSSLCPFTGKIFPYSLENVIKHKTQQQPQDNVLTKSKTRRWIIHLHKFPPHYHPPMEGVRFSTTNSPNLDRIFNNINTHSATPHYRYFHNLRIPKTTHVQTLNKNPTTTHLPKELPQSYFSNQNGCKSLKEK